MKNDLKEIVKKYDWEPYLSRPYSFLMSTWWHEVYSSVVIKKLLGARVSKSLLISNKGVVTKFVSKREWKQVQKRFTKLVADEPEKFSAWLSYAEHLFANVDRIVKTKKRLKIKQALRILNEVTIYGTFVPLFGGQWLYSKNKLYYELQKKVTSLRAKSYYPIVYSKIFLPAVRDFFRNHNIPVSYIEYATLKEILNRNFNSLQSRKQAILAGKEFVFFSDGKSETILLLDSPFMSGASGGQANFLKGQVAYKGKVMGKVCVINSLQGLHRDFDREKVVLVAVSTNPSLVRTMKKAVAIVTDEGGVTSHAAILARELKKPCIIGTKIATQVLKDGDLVEVDAEKGVVKILKRA
jgi:pyruvate, water dikinase